MTSTPKLMTTDVVRLSREAGIDPRTARAWLAGSTIRGALLEQRIARAAAELGLARSTAQLGNSPPPAAA